MYEEIEIQLSLEDYFQLNEMARKERKLLDDYINDILRKKLEEEGVIEKKDES